MENFIRMNLHFSNLEDFTIKTKDFSKVKVNAPILLQLFLLSLLNFYRVVNTR